MRWWNVNGKYYKQIKTSKSILPWFSFLFQDIIDAVVKGKYGDVESMLNEGADPNEAEVKIEKTPAWISHFSYSFDILS